MKITSEIAKWLRENAYAVKGSEYWFLSDFPSSQTPDRLEIPMKDKAWQSILKSIYEALSDR